MGGGFPLQNEGKGKGLGRGWGGDGQWNRQIKAHVFIKTTLF